MSFFFINNSKQISHELVLARYLVLSCYFLHLMLLPYVLIRCQTFLKWKWPLLEKLRANFANKIGGILSEEKRYGYDFILYYCQF